MARSRKRLSDAEFTRIEQQDFDAYLNALGIRADGPRNDDHDDGYDDQSVIPGQSAYAAQLDHAAPEAVAFEASAPAAASPAAPFAISVARRVCFVEPGSLGARQLARFDPFLVPSWVSLPATGMRSRVSGKLISRFRQRNPRASQAQLQLESMCYSMLASFPRRGMIAVRGICVACDRRAYLFSSPSRGAAERLALLWKQYLGDAVQIVGEGWIALAAVKRGRERYVEASGTPWCNRRGWARNVTLPLDAWCFVGDAPVPDAPPADASSAAVPSAPSRRGIRKPASARRAADGNLVDEAVRYAFMPSSPAAVGQTLTLLDTVMTLTPMNACAIGASERDAARTYEQLTGNSYAADRIATPLPVVVDEHTWQPSHGSTL